jgi:hypothetical protein
MLVKNLEEIFRNILGRVKILASNVFSCARRLLIFWRSWLSNIINNSFCPFVGSRNHFLPHISTHVVFGRYVDCAIEACIPLARIGVAAENPDSRPCALSALGLFATH